ncbi:Manganese-dependent protein-tyrosine phosphatase [hydrothermal vent metagenome]|uniref:Manganese-dependent protein-tyrosine phosphatase n=1 Tax=hydrothermal vent metagenome TaxID=652676 RepID=A0A3B1B427_9ZZZZ
MFDLHSHILPGIDDGAQTTGIALEMASQAVADGITHIILTPHIQPGVYDNDIHTISSAFTAFKTDLTANHIPLAIGMAAEVRISFEIIQMVIEERIPFLGTLDGYKILLLEFPHSHILPGTEKLIDFLIQRNIRPLIAHPERINDVLRDLDKLRCFIDAGCLMQVTASSIAGFFGEAIRITSEQMLERDWIHVLATDAHNTTHRIPEMSPGREAVARLAGEETAWKLVRDNPAAICNSQFR